MGEVRPFRNPLGRTPRSPASFRTISAAQRLRAIDYTQDFSGVLDRKGLVHFLQESGGFREKGGPAVALEEE